MEPHFTHLSFPESIEIAKKINAKETYLIHMTHNLEYEVIKKDFARGYLCWLRWFKITN